MASVYLKSHLELSEIYILLLFLLSPFQILSAGPTHEITNKIGSKRVSSSLYKDPLKLARDFDNFFIT